MIDRHGGEERLEQRRRDPLRIFVGNLAWATTEADRKNKRPFCASAPGACPLKPPAPPAGGHATPTALPVHSEARRSATPRSTPDVGHTPQDGGEEGSEGSHRGKASGQAVLESRISMGFETPRGGMSSRNLLCAHVACEPTCDVVGIRRPNRMFPDENGREQ